MSSNSSLSRLKELLPELFQPTQLPGEIYLRFQLTREVSGLISMDDVQESLLVSEENITPIPNTLSSVMGLMSSRDRVFCAIDLAHLIGISYLSPYLQKLNIIVLNISKYLGQTQVLNKELFLGIAVSKVEGIVRVMSEQIQSMEEIGRSPSSLNPYLKGYLIHNEEQLLLFDTLAIVTKACGEADG